MSNKIWIATLALFSLTLMPGIVADEGSPAPADDATCSALQQIAETLRQLRSDQRALLMIRLVELGDRRMAPLRDEARTAREEVQRLRREFPQFEAGLEMMREQWETAVANGTEQEMGGLRFEIDQFESLIEMRQEEIRDAELRAAEAEIDLARQQSRIADLDAKLEELLELLDERE